MDELDPYPFVDGLDVVQLWPETAHGAGHYRIWEFEEFDTGGFAPRLPPEGLHWITADEMRDDVDSPHTEVLGLVRRNPRSDAGVVFDPDAATVDATWGYAYESEEGGGVRVMLPWRGRDEKGSVQLDFAYDERLPDPPVFAAVPRGDGGEPTVVRSASPELSLAWKVEWLSADQAGHGRVAGKDLYDAVLLAELNRMRLPDRLRRMVLRALPDPSAVRDWDVDWSTVRGHVAADPQIWLDRLARALRRILPVRG